MKELTELEQACTAAWPLKADDLPTPDTLLKVIDAMNMAAINAGAPHRCQVVPVINSMAGAGAYHVFMIDGLYGCRSFRVRFPWEQS